MIGVSLAFSSTVLAVKVLEDNGELSTLYGRDVLSILILQDVVAIGLLALSNGTQPDSWAFGLLLLPLLRPIAHRLLNASRANELVLLLGVSLALDGGWLAERVNISSDIGALLMGVMLAGHTKTEELAEKLWGLKETFLVAFFLQIGLNHLPGYDDLIQALLLLSLLPLQGEVFFYLISGGRTSGSHGIHFVIGVNDLQRICVNHVQRGGVRAVAAARLGSNYRPGDNPVIGGRRAAEPFLASVICFPGALFDAF